MQNGTSPQRVVRFSLGKDNLRLTQAETLEANHADFNEPTLGVLAGEDFYFIANSQCEMVNEKGEVDRAGKMARAGRFAPAFVRFNLTVIRKIAFYF